MEVNEFKDTIYFGNMVEEARLFFKFNDWNIWEY